MSTESASGRPKPPGRPARWGVRQSSTLSFPTGLHEVLKDEAERAGYSLTEYVSLCLAPMHGIKLPDPRPPHRRWPVTLPGQRTTPSEVESEFPMGA